MRTDYVWIVIVKSESGDTYGPLVYRHKPSTDDLEDTLRLIAPGEWDGNDGPGFEGSYLHVDPPIRVPVRDVE